MKRISWMLLVLLAVTSRQSVFAAPSLPSAKAAAAMANKEMGSESANLVIRLDGVNADSDLRLRQWDVTVYDSTMPHRGTMIRIKDGIIVSATGACRFIDDPRLKNFDRNFTGYSTSEVIKMNRWKLDSNDAIAKVAALPELSKIQIVNCKMTLRKTSDGDVPPVWRVTVKGRLKSQPLREAWIGYVDLSAETGEIITNETKPERFRN